MTIVNKAILITALTWAGYVVVNLLPASHQSLLSIALIVSFFALLNFGLLKVFIFDRVKKLKNEMIAINKKSGITKFQPLNDSGYDDISKINKNINTLLDDFKKTQQQLDKLQINSKVLKQTNFDLQREISHFISAEKKSLQTKENVTQQSKSDVLATIPNRMMFNEILNKSISHAKRRNKILAILHIDLDTFKKIDDNLAPTKSNEAINDIGNRLTHVLRAEDFIAKLEGNEFIVLLNDIGKAKFASTVAEKLLSVCSHPVVIESNEIIISAHIGISVFPIDGESLENLLQHAEEALYKAKQSGNSYQFYTREIDIEAHEHIKMETALRKSIQNNEISLYYQPKLNIKKGTITGIETLVRWEHPQLGSISPAKFIPLAEEIGFIMQLGEWIIREACKINKHWQEEGYEHVTISVNLSPKQFHHPDIVKLISSILSETGLNPKYLELEISEQVIMDNIELASSILNNIKSIGVQLAIDHFGVGYTSISYLKILPISTIKIDRSFIKGVPNNPNDLAVCNAVIALAHNLGFETLAEGVETAEQVQYLATQNCDLIQGYFLSHPVPDQKIILQFRKLRDEVVLI